MLSLIEFFKERKNTTNIRLPSDNLGIKRKDMPQIESAIIEEFVDFLTDNGYKISRKLTPVSSLKMTQSEVNDDKVRKLMALDKLDSKKPIIVSSDNYILDGHHRFAALYNKDKSIKIHAIHVNIDMKTLLKVASEFPKVRYKNINEFVPFHTYINEALITFGNKSYPRFNQVVILAGGAGSGKGFVNSKLLGIEGKVLDVDELKKAAIASDKISTRVKKETGVDLKNLSLKKPENVSKLHAILNDVTGTIKQQKSSFFRGVITANENRKPNIIFDVTLKDFKKLKSISKDAEKLGYSKENIHIVWVLNDYEVAVDQNAKRDRVVPSDILLKTHEGAAYTMSKILEMGDSLKTYMDGDIFIAWNKFKVDSDLVKSDKGGSYIKRSDYLKLKSRGSSQIPLSKLDKTVKNKITSYIPNKDLLF